MMKIFVVRKTLKSNQSTVCPSRASRAIRPVDSSSEAKIATSGTITRPGAR